MNEPDARPARDALLQRVTTGELRPDDAAVLAAIAADPTLRDEIADLLRVRATLDRAAVAQRAQVDVGRVLRDLAAKPPGSARPDARPRPRGPSLSQWLAISALAACALAWFVWPRDGIAPRPETTLGSRIDVHPIEHGDTGSLTIRWSVRNASAAYHAARLRALDDGRELAHADHLAEPAWTLTPNARRSLPPEALLEVVARDASGSAVARSDGTRVSLR